MVDLSIKNVKQLVILAFADVEKDSSQTLHQAQYTDNGMSDGFSVQEYKAAAKKDADKNWQGIKRVDLEMCDAVLSHATLQNWRYFLAPHLVYAIDAIIEEDFAYNLLSRAVFHLHYYVNAGESENSFLLERFATLTTLQNQAVKQFLEFCVQESLKDIEKSNTYVPLYDDAKAALASHWCRY